MLKHFKTGLSVLCVVITITACQNTEKQLPTKPADTLALQAEIPPVKKLEVPLPSFPTMTYKIEHLIRQHYEIELEADGDLNGDGVVDKALVLINKKDTTGVRTALVLLKQGNAYSVSAISHSAIEPKYRKDGFKIYDYESIAIDSGKLVISMQATGRRELLKATTNTLTRS